ncbi:hypothetical protein ACNKHL_01105 [Shigella flexneri]
MQHVEAFSSSSGIAAISSGGRHSSPAACRIISSAQSMMVSVRKTKEVELHQSGVSNVAFINWVTGCLPSSSQKSENRYFWVGAITTTARLPALRVTPSSLRAMSIQRLNFFIRFVDFRQLRRSCFKRFRQRHPGSGGISF